MAKTGTAALSKDFKPIKVGPFTWARHDSGDDECWDIVYPQGLEHKLTHWAVKNYGGNYSSEAFSGWRLVSGGPFCSAGIWTSRDDAMRGVIPFLMQYFRDSITEKNLELARTQKMLDEFAKEILP